MKEVNFNNLFIEEIKFKIGEGGLACGPVPGALYTQIKFIDGDKVPYYLLLVEFESFPNFLLTDEDKFDLISDEESEDTDDIGDYISKHNIDSFGKVVFDIDYDDLFSNIYENKLENTEEGKLIRYIISITRCATDDLEDYMNVGLKKNVKDIDIPLIDVELDYLESL